jgi:5'-3' exonuclease
MLPELLGIDSSCVIMANYYVQRKYVSEEQLTAEFLADITIRAVQNLQARLVGISNVKVVLLHDIGKSFRYRLFPEYKAGRPDHEHYKSIKMDCIRLIGEKSNIINFGVDGLEADDLAYLMATQFTDCWFVSNDNDWKTILNHPAQRFYKYTNPVGWYDICNTVEPKYKLIMEKILLGCKSDKIPSILKPAKFKNIDWGSVPDSLIDTILAGELIDYGWFFERTLTAPLLSDEFMVDQLYEQAEKNWRLTFYSWGNYIDYAYEYSLRNFNDRFQELFKQEFQEQFA